MAKEIKIGEPGYVNKNCWLAVTLGHSPSKRCQYCDSKFPNCLFFRYLIITLVMIVSIFIISFVIHESISKLVVITVFILVIVYGYFFSKSTEDIIAANFFQSVERCAKEDLVRTDEVKNQFLAIVNHHLRTPLTAISWYIDLLLSGKYGKIPAKSKDIINKIGASTAEEIKVVDELLSVSQLQMNNDTVKAEEEIDIEELFIQFKKNEELELKQKGIYLNIEKVNDIFPIPADRCKIKLALENIVDNAVKYTEKGGVTIKLQGESDVLKITVKDAGIGMDESTLKNIFSKTFERGDQAQKIFATGRGIGLYLSSKIIEAHNGKIRAESAGKGKGSAFIIELPIKKHIDKAL